MSDQSRIQTIGPADPNAPLAAKAYTVVSSLLGLVTLAATFNVITTDQASAVSGVAAAGVGLVGAVTTAVAAFRTRKQVNNGTFDPAPPPAATPVLDAMESINAIKTHLDQTVDAASAKVAEGVSVIKGAAEMIPGGKLITDVVLSGSVGDLVQAMADRAGGVTDAR